MTLTHLRAVIMTTARRLTTAVIEELRNHRCFWSVDPERLATWLVNDRGTGEASFCNRTLAAVDRAIRHRRGDVDDPRLLAGVESIVAELLEQSVFSDEGLRERQREACLEKNLGQLLNWVGEPGECKFCGRRVAWVTHRNTKGRAPWDSQGIHFETCAKADEARRKPAAEGGR